MEPTEDQTYHDMRVLHQAKRATYNELKDLAPYQYSIFGERGAWLIDSARMWDMSIVEIAKMNQWDLTDPVSLGIVSGTVEFQSYCGL